MTGIATGPTEALLSLGEARPIDASKWLAYRADVGLTDEHVSELTRVACDPVLNGAETDSKEVWAPVHAWRALGQLRAAAAVEPLLRYLARVEDDDSVSVDFPLVFGMIGYPALRRRGGTHTNARQQRIVSRKSRHKIPSIGGSVSIF